MSRTIRCRLEKLENANKDSKKMFAMLTFQDGTRKALKSMEVSFAWLCGSIADEQGRVVVNIEIMPDGRREHEKELEIIQQILRGGK
ncbi:MAG: hypothetical protein IIX45_09985 [Lachnospiraceae bacterium]|nr:hypothetical protein [Lachnospiraceae bacterium]